MLESLTVEFLPYNYAGTHGGTERLYRLTTVVNGLKRETQYVAQNIPPTMSELDFLVRMAYQMKKSIEEK